ncbi:MAG: sigma-70 family RNA polymerase sigma factor [Ignavibacteriae bacterium]|nr:sigma-70 family RNA polymerase sigma factor [Ignavibacteriota bacterium]MCB9206103.1 sigma-70 family RNA polymerase sigma factor [Ignavibacteriales bacterium]MCB9209376.1 sigma-70 family RNA polymerase sigma factor [Ignavibacteriales bacterium]MCB9258019.1 sigma-70 family RNA polymerase sigma factor [Ignavibacteriales bacterium]
MDNTTLWTEFKIEPSSGLKKQIMVNYTNLVHYVIHNSKFMNLNVVEEKDYFQFGIEGLSEAIDRFDPDFGTKFETYAIQRIRGKIIDELRKLQIKPRANYQNQDPNRIMYRNVSLDQPYDSDETFTLSDIIPSEYELPDDEYHALEKKELLVQAIKDLNERDRLIITLYYYEHMNYKEISKILDITVSRVSQLHSKIMKELKKKIEREYD